MEELWRCEILMEALKNRPAPCAELVRSQFTKGGLRLKMEFHLPEPWTGVPPEEVPVANGEARIPLLFLTRTAPFRPGECDAPTLSHDLASYASFYTRRLASRLGRFELPEPGERFHTFGHVEIRCVEEAGSERLIYYEPERAAEKPAEECRLWTELAGAARRLLDRGLLSTLNYDDEKGILGKHAVIMPLVHCKATAEVGVSEAVQTCVRRHTRRLLRRFHPRLVVAVGGEVLRDLETAGLLSSPCRMERQADSGRIPVCSMDTDGETLVPLLVMRHPEAPPEGEGPPSLEAVLRNPAARHAIRRLIQTGEIAAPLYS